MHLIFIFLLATNLLMADSLTFGIFAYKSTAKTLKEYQPIADHLSKELNTTIILKALSQEELEEQVSQGKIDIIATNPTHFLSLHAKGHISGPMVTEVKRYDTFLTPYLGGVIVTRSDRHDIRTLQDLKSKVIAIPGKKFLGGFQTQNYEFEKLGINLNKDCKFIEVSNHNAVIKSVLEGKADAGFVRTGIIEEMSIDKEVDSSKLFIINEYHYNSFPLKISTELYPEWAIATSVRLPVQTVQKIVLALYSYKPISNERGIIEGFTIPADYTAIDSLARALRLAPYENAPNFTFADVWEKYKFWIMMLTISGIIIFILLITLYRMVVRQNKSEATLEKLLNDLKEQNLALDSHAIVAITDVKGNITFVNKKFEEISGYSSGELIGCNHRVLNSDKQPKSYWKSMYETISRGNQWHDVVCNKAKDGHLYWVDTTIVPFIGKDGKPQSYIAIRTDVTKNKEIEVELRQFKNTLDQMLECVFMFDPKSLLFTYLNKGAMQQVGYSETELMQMTAADIKPLVTLEQLQQIIQPLIEGVLPSVNFQTLHRHKDGHDIPVEIFLQLVSLEGLPPRFVAMVSDISERKKIEVELLKAKEAAEDSARSKSEFLASMSHEIRTPMNGVLGMLGLLEHSPLDNTQRHRVHVAQSSATSLLGLINDILDFSKIEAGKMDLENIEFNLRDELGEFAEAIAFRAQEKGLEIILDTTQVHLQNIVADPGRLRQIMTNIVGNAVKFTHRGHVLIRVSIKTIDETHGRLFIDITDTGIGIPPEKIETLFEAFSQADGSTTRKYGGTGLGLSIVKRLCELMGGSVKATSIPHQGSTFSIEVEIGFGIKSEQVIPSISVEGKTVLIVDDNEVNRAVVRAQLEQWGMIVEEAKDAMTAFDMCQVQISKGHIPPYDVALVDMQMPDMDGAKLGQEIRKISECDQLKMIMMTSLGSRHDAKIFADLGFNAFFAKPTTAKDLLNALKVLFDDGEALRSADPLLTKDYLGTLKDGQSSILWPESTRILLVEDNTTNQLVAQGMLESIGLRADIAANGLEALESLQLAQEESVPYTFILMDCQMPEMDGYTASTAIRAGKAGEANKKIPIVAMTANAMSGDREKCILAGMDDYVSKPINLSVLKAMLVKWILKDGVVELPLIEKNETETIVEKTILTQLPLWDKADAMSRLGNNTTLLNMVMQSFMSDGLKSLALLNTAIQQNNSEDAQLHAHSLKGSAGNVSALKLQEIAKHLEELARNKKLDDVQAGYNECEQVLNETLSLFESHLAKELKPTVKKKRLDPLQMAIKLQDLKKEIEAGGYINTDTFGIFADYADEVLTARLNTLKGHIDRFDTDLVLKQIEAIMAELE